MDQNEPAFPLSVEPPAQEIYYGITKIDYFAAAALTGIIANRPNNFNAKGMAYDAVKIAKELIKQLEQQ